MDHNFMKKNLLFHASKVKIQTKYNYFQWVAKKYKKFKKINPNFMGYILFYSLSKQKNSNLNSYATFILSTNLSDYSASLWNFFGDPLVCKQRMLSLVWNALNFFSHYPCMKPWHLNKSHDFQTLFAIFSFSRTSVRSIAVMFRDKHASTIYFFRWYSITFHPDTWI